MIEFRGVISEKCKKYIWNRETKFVSLACIIASLIFSVIVVIAALKVNLIILMFLLLTIGFAILGSFPQKGIDEKLPQSISIENDEILLDNSLYVGLNISSSFVTIAGRLGMRAIGTKNGNPLQKAKPYSRITKGYKTVQYNGKGDLYWSIHRTSHSKNWITNPHWHMGAGGGTHFESFMELIFAFLRRF